MANTRHNTFLSQAAFTIDRSRVEQAVYRDISPEIIMEVMAKVYAECFAAQRSPQHIPLNRRFRKRLATVRQR